MPRRERARLDLGARALALLERRPHFRAELAAKLRRAGGDASEIAELLDTLAARRLLDDQTLTLAFAEELVRRRGFGRARIGRELARRGAPAPAVEEALAGLSPEDELERAREVAGKWARSGGGVSAALARHLDRRGFPRHVIFRVLREFVPETETLPEDD